MLLKTKACGKPRTIAASSLTHTLLLVSVLTLRPAEGLTRVGQLRFIRNPNLQSVRVIKYVLLIVFV